MMDTEHKSGLLDDIAKIYQHAREYEGDDCCMVPASPELQEKIKNQMNRLAGRANLAGPTTLRFKEPTAVGLNDGLIYPGDFFPLGTPLRTIRNAAANRAPLRGTLRIIVVLVDFSDKAFTQTQDHFRDLFFSTGVLPNGSVKEYFKEVSNNLIDIAGDVVGPYRLPSTLATYAHGDSGMSSALPNARTMARDAAAAANPNVNYSLYDNNSDGFVDAFIVIHAGPGAEVTGNAGDIWSHKWVLDGGAYAADGTNIYAYLTVPEDCRIGVCCHELGHLLFGFPDLYDTDYSSSGVGNWCLMAGGSWNGRGDIPAHPSAWCKANQGWVSVNVPTGSGVVNISDVKTGRTVYRLWKNGSSGSEYFLLENRQKALYDRELPGDGLLIWHVDESIASNSNEVHPKVALLQADGLKNLESGTNRGDTGDPFPGSTNNSTFNHASNPSSKSYANVSTCVSVTNIGPSGPVITARIGVRCIVKTKEVLPDKSLVVDKPRLLDKRPEKPIIDKAIGFDKGMFEKRGDGGLDLPGAFGQQSDWTQSLMARVTELEQRMAAVEPFIGEDLRPDLRASALLGEEDMGEMGSQSQMLEGGTAMKRQYDTKQSET